MSGTPTAAYVAIAVERDRLRVINVELLQALKQCANAEQWLSMPEPKLGLTHISKIAARAIAKAESKP